MSQKLTRSKKNAGGPGDVPRPPASLPLPAKATTLTSHKTSGHNADDNANRAAALDLLLAVLRRRRPLDEALDEVPSLLVLPSRDRAFVHRLVATTLRRLGEIDAVIDHCLEHSLAPKLVDVRAILRLGAAQIVFLGTPVYAAVDTMVDLASRTEGGAYKGLVNAVLRRLTREGQEIAATLDTARANTPAWLWDSWQSAWGEDVCRRIAEAHQHEAPLDLTLMPGQPDWGTMLQAHTLPTGSLRLTPDGPITAMPGYAEGGWWVQDAAASMPARLLGEIRGQTVIDLCAAPGGKTAQMAAAGAHVIAVDRSPKRLERLSANMARLGLTVSTVVADATSWRPSAPVDAVLLDALCTATGTIRRHPDVAYLKSQNDVAKVAAIQSRLLAAAIDMVKPGGLVVYSVCSLQPEEREDQIAAVLAAGQVRRLPVRASELGAGLAGCVSGVGDLCTFPFHLSQLGGMDGFYAARLRKVGA